MDFGDVFSLEVKTIADVPSRRAKEGGAKEGGANYTLEDRLKEAAAADTAQFLPQSVT